MKKVFAVVASIAMFALSMTSCQKDESVLKFKATIERGDTKTSLNAVNADNEHPITWDAEDEIKVWGNSTTNGYYFVTQQSGNSVEFTTTESTGNLGNSTSFEAGYPADMWETGIGNHLVNLPTERVYRENNIYKFPMYATSNNTSLEFKNVCGVLKIQLPQINKQINGIAIYASSAIAGEFSVSMLNGVPFLTEVAGADELEMQFNEPVDLTNGKYFYIYLPSSSDLGQTNGFTGFEMMFFATDGTYAVARANAGIVIERSKITTVNLGGIQFDQQVETSNNYFSVSPTLKVDISQGNLQYVTTSRTWRFAPHQYDFIGAKETNENYHVIDMFARSSSENDYGLMHGLDNNSSITITSINGDFRDWGALMSSESTPWRTLSHSEWNYLFGQRDGHERLCGAIELDLSYEDADIVPYDVPDYDYVWDMIKIYNVRGFILLPDGSEATIPSASSPISVAALNTFLTTNNAVFIPMVYAYQYGHILYPTAHGVYWNSNMQYGTNHNTNDGHFGQTNSAYWDDYEGGFFPFYAVEKIDVTDPRMFSYFSVRLVRNAMHMNAEGHWVYTHSDFVPSAKSRKK